MCPVHQDIGECLICANALVDAISKHNIYISARTQGLPSCAPHCKDIIVPLYTSGLLLLWQIRYI